MCIILHHPEKAKLPHKSQLQNCFEKNADGAGFMVVRDDKIRVRKGFMNFTDFWAGYTNERFTEADEFAVHFRWATAGGVSKANTHPFPLTDDHAELRALKYNTDIAMMHNGVVGFGLGTLSDTMLYVVEELSILRDHLSDDSVIEYISDYTAGSRLIFFDLKSGNVLKTGAWVEDKLTGNFYSNKDWISPKKKAVKYYGAAGYDYSEYDGKYYRGKDISLPMGQDFRSATQKRWDKERELRATLADSNQNTIDVLFRDELSCPNCTHSDIIESRNTDKLIHSFDAEDNIIITCSECNAVFDERGNVFDYEYGEDEEDEYYDVKPEDDYIMCPECGRVILYDEDTKSYICQHSNCTANYLYTSYICPYCHDKYGTSDHILFDLTAEEYICPDCCGCYTYKYVSEYRQNRDKIETPAERRDRKKRELLTSPIKAVSFMYNCSCTNNPALYYTHNAVAGESILYVCPNGDCSSDYYYSAFLDRIVMRRKPSMSAWKTIPMISVLRCGYCNCYLNYTAQDRANEYFCPECDRKYYNSITLQRNVLRIR